MVENKVRGLSSVLHGLLNEIKDDNSAQTCLRFVQEINKLKTGAPKNQVFRVSKFVADNLLYLPIESDMIEPLQQCVDDCLESAYQYKTKAKLLNKSITEICGLELSNEDRTQGALITLEPRDNSKLRASFFNAGGFFGDASRRSVSELIDHLWEDRYIFESPGLLQKMSATLEWQEGSSATLDAQMVMQQTIPFSEYEANRACRKYCSEMRALFNRLSLEHGTVSDSDLIAHMQEHHQVTPTSLMLDTLRKSPDKFIPPNTNLFVSYSQVDHNARLAPDLHIYGLRARPASMGSVPSGFIQLISKENSLKFLSARQLNLSEDDCRHGLVVYSMPLEPRVVQNFELKIPSVLGEAPPRPDDLDDVDNLKNYAMQLLNAGFVSREELKAVYRDPSMLQELVDRVSPPKNPKEEFAVMKVIRM